MGLRLSQLLVQTHNKEIMSFESSFPEDILIEILSFVSAEDLLNNCVIVCREWKDMIEGHGIWKRKCVREGKAIPPCIFHEIPPNYYRAIYISNPFGRNLLKNPSGEDVDEELVEEGGHVSDDDDDRPFQPLILNGAGFGPGGLYFDEEEQEFVREQEIVGTGHFKHYFLIHGGDGWAVEDPPKGADPVPKEVGSTSCFATSYHISSARQMIYLNSVERIPVEVMDVIKPDIVVGEWYAARFDCGSIYRLSVQLLDQDENALDSFQFEHREEQWTGKAWSEVTHRFNNYPAGVRIISFEHSGEDTQFWAGNYGSKMTGGYVKFDFT